MSNKKYEVAAYYFPNYHRDPRNDLWHGQGWTEWELVKAAKSRYPGHQQPKVPAWGYFDESDPAWAAKEIDLAADHAVTTFMYDWYWYEDGPYLNDGLEKGFLKAANKDRLKFAIMWANHDWLNIHPALFRNQPEQLTHGKISAEAFDRMTDYIVERYFSASNYLCFDRCPYFSIYELGRFIEGIGGLAGAVKALQKFRQKTIAAGFRDLHLNGVMWSFRVLPAELACEDPAKIVKELGLASTTTYAWVHEYDLASGGFPRGSYDAAARGNMAAWDIFSRQMPVPYHPNVSMGWDPSPRTIQTSPYENRGYPWTPILEGNTPAAFEQVLRRAKDWLDSRQDGATRMLMLNAWNEWTEGSYLLPDVAHGTAYLDAVKSVFDPRD